MSFKHIVPITWALGLTLVFDVAFRNRTEEFFACKRTHIFETQECVDLTITQKTNLFTFAYPLYCNSWDTDVESTQECTKFVRDVIPLMYSIEAPGEKRTVFRRLEESNAFLDEYMVNQSASRLRSVSVQGEAAVYRESADTHERERQ